MYYEQESGATGFITGVLIGALLGASVALLTAPHKGTVIRARLVDRVRPSRHDADARRVTRRRVRARP
jgi:gas vesicle protein